MIKGSEKREAGYPVDKIFVDRWSPRAMSGEGIGEEELMTLFEAARWAPSSYNNQPWRILYARRETVSLVAVDELAEAGDDDVELVARVRLLWVNSARGVNLDDETAVLKRLRETLAARARQERQRLRDAHTPTRGSRTNGTRTDGFLHFL